MNERAIGRKPGEKELAIQEELEKIFNGETNSFVAIHREGISENTPGLAKYRAYGKVPDMGGKDSEEDLALFLLNFLDGFLDKEKFVMLSHMVATRALERMGITADQVKKDIETVSSALGLRAATGKVEKPN